jgi:hypothetical protein
MSGPNSITVSVGVGHGKSGPTSQIEGYPTSPGCTSAVLASTQKTDATALAAAQVTAAADVAVLVADGATPTQAHVTTLNTDYTALATAIATSVADVSANPSANVVIVWDATITKRAQLRSALRSALTLLNGSSILS